ncbi:hypothetical protein NDU88_004129 [Pleurodeles waltl]|uniref:Uncharacterized protein n=1 Tax=Pleurodeles waltl TaxID=8319 RepID=A0AAV7QEL7_PLEWA|nr:hypothetical protein NDU88_004129 [Pleurodeles waltl]
MTRSHTLPGCPATHLQGRGSTQSEVWPRDCRQTRNAGRPRSSPKQPAHVPHPVGCPRAPSRSPPVKHHRQPPQLQHPHDTLLPRANPDRLAGLDLPFIATSRAVHCGSNGEPCEERTDLR